MTSDEQQQTSNEICDSGMQSHGSDSWKCAGDGNRSILPMSLLQNLKRMVQERIGFISRQVIAGDVMPAPTPVTSDQVADDGDQAENFKFPDSVECTDSKEKQKGRHEKKSKREIYLKKRKASSLSTSSVEEGASPYTKRKRPNYFVAVQVTNPEILAIAKKIQAGIQENCEVNLKKAFVGLEKSHVTLMVMHLLNKEEVKKAADGLDLCAAAISERTGGQPVILDFEGLSTFSGGRVLFATLKETEGLEHLHFMADEVSKQMSLSEISSTDKSGKSFNPHLTLMKFEGDYELRKQGIKKVEAHLYEPYVNEVFGAQTVCSLQLCSMTKKKREDGYYFVEHEVSFCK